MLITLTKKMLNLIYLHTYMQEILLIYAENYPIVKVLDIKNFIFFTMDTGFISNFE